MSAVRRGAPVSRGLTFTILAGVLWGSTFVAIQVGLATTGPGLLVALRFELAAGGAIVLASVLRLSGPIRAELRRGPIWGLGALYSAGFALQFFGQAAAGIANSTLLSNLYPAFVPLLAGPLLGERWDARHGFAVGLSVLGLAAVASVGFTAGGPSLVGDGLLVGSAIVYALFIVVSKRVGAVTPGSALALIVVMAAVFAPVVLLEGLADPAGLALPASAWGAVVFLALPGTVVALALYLVGLRDVSASRSSLLLLLEPVTGLGLAAIGYRASITMPVIVGTLLLVGAIAMVPGGVGPRSRGGTRPKEPRRRARPGRLRSVPPSRPGWPGHARRGTPPSSVTVKGGARSRRGVSHGRPVEGGASPDPAVPPEGPSSGRPPLARLGPRDQPLGHRPRDREDATPGPRPLPGRGRGGGTGRCRAGAL